jgi:hypothetical protein
VSKDTVRDRGHGYSGICVAQRTMIYATKEDLDVTMVNWMYMDLSTSTGLDIWIIGGRTIEISSICSVEQ